MHAPPLDAEPVLTGPDPDHPFARVNRWWLAASTPERAAAAIDAALLGILVIFVLAQLSPSLLIADTTPTGGDMGAHVWGPAYLRDILLPDLRLTGWTQDWYAGFPAFHFYMVVPALAIVAFNTGFQGWGSLAALAVAIGLVVVGLLPGRRIPWRVAALPLGPARLLVPFPDPDAAVRARRLRRLALAGAAVVVLLAVGLPYGVAFKWVTVVGLVALPLCAYALGRLADLPYPAPPLLAVGAVVFLFNMEPNINGTGRIIGGNVASTLAGEYSFSISLAFAVLYLGYLLRGLRTGRHLGTAAVLLALTALCHGIPVLYAAVATGVALLVSGPWPLRRLAFAVAVPPLAVALSAFWLGPFLLRHDYLNNMGWERVPHAGSDQDYFDYLAPGGLRWVLALAAVGALLSAILKIRLGLVLAICAVISVLAFIHLPEGELLWNARLLPFLFLCLCLLAAVGVSEVARGLGSLMVARPRDAANGITIATVPVAAAVALMVVALPLGILPGTDRTGDGYEWQGFTVSGSDRNVVRDWARWNFAGIERKDAYPEYFGMIEMMRGVADDPRYGCGRAMWEYDDTVLNRYGTPMAPMLLPYFTDGCIGSMEGLYFESSVTTPYHFLMQRTLSDDCSCAQRDMPYSPDQDIELGVAQMRLLGVKYYMAFTETMVQAADGHPDLTEIATDGPWHVYLVANESLVAPLSFEPVVLTDVGQGRDWMGPASAFFQDQNRYDVLLAADGPDTWSRLPVCESGTKADDESPLESFRRLDVCGPAPRTALTDVSVSGIEVGDDRLSFTVSDVGVPVLVRMSYFPNWQASGADGPYRVAPNLMVVIPTDTTVELTYGWTGVDLGSYAATAVGIAALVLLLALRRRPRSPGRIWLDGPQPILATLRDRPYEPPEGVVPASPVPPPPYTADDGSP